MTSALLGFALFLIVAIAADYRVLNSLFCLFKSLTHRAFSPDAKGNHND